MPDRRELSKYRFDLAKECLVDSILLLSNDSFVSSVSRSYYAIFNSLRAILALDGMDFKKHSGVISYFQKEYVKTGKFASVISDYIRAAFIIRNDSDYQDFFVVSKEDAETQIQNAQKVIEAVSAYLGTTAGESEN
jgi:uncharacterized protein (UPF0332 family)